VQQRQVSTLPSERRCAAAAAILVCRASLAPAPVSSTDVAVGWASWVRSAGWRCDGRGALSRRSASSQGAREAPKCGGRHQKSCRARARHAAAGERRRLQHGARAASLRGGRGGQFVLRCAASRLPLCKREAHRAATCVPLQREALDVACGRVYSDAEGQRRGDRGPSKRLSRWWDRRAQGRSGAAQA
jgi:hypothetical protein